jgi:DNA-binding NarL/FixJ family response regulator/class 3 adenylate cyclase
MPELPAGTVTLLFTDIESSTRLVQVLGDAYGDALEQHRDLVRAAVQAAGGTEIDCRGDEISIVFREATNAVTAAFDAQRALAAHDWPGGEPLRIRMGLHTGTPAREGRSYLGVDVHVTARVCEAGHGGQVLVSSATRTAVDGYEFRDLGEHELRGLERPERLYQLVAPGLELDFPPLRLDGQAARAGTEPDADAVKVVLADDSVLLREGIARLLEDAGFDVVGQVANVDDLLLKVRSYSPDVAIVDIRMPPTFSDEGLRAAKEIRAKYPGTGVLLLSQYVEPAYAMELLAESAEGVGYLLKDRVADIPEFVASVRRVAEGGSALDPSLISQLVGRRRADDPLARLTPREREVLDLMAEGLSNQAVADRLVVTERAVEKHVTSIFGKLRLPADAESHRRVLAVLAYLRS